MLPLLHPFSSCYLPQMQTELSKKYIVKIVLHRPAQTERGFQWFKISFQLPDNSTTNSYSQPYTKQGAIGVTGEEQYQINNPTKPYIIPLQLLNS